MQGIEHSLGSRQDSRAELFKHLRAKIIDLLEDTRPGWRSVTVSSDGGLIIQSADGSEKIIRPPTKRKD